MAQTHLFDQGRNVLTLVPGALLDAAPAARTYGPYQTGGTHTDSGGYNWISGFFFSDQPFTVQVYQGRVSTDLMVRRLYTAALDAAVVRWVVRIKEPIYGEYASAVLTNLSVLAQTVLDGELYLMPVEGSPLTPSSTGGLQVEGTDDDGAVHSNNPIQIAGFLPGAPPYTVTVPSVANPGGILARQLIIRPSDGTNYGPIMDANTRRGYVQPTDGTHDLAVVSQGVAVEATGTQILTDYEAVPAAVATGQAARLQGTAYGRIEPAAFSRAIGADQTLEVAPVEYDVSSSTLRASAVLTAAGAFDAAPIEIPTANRKYVSLVMSYTRAAVGGAFCARIEKAITIAGTDYWSRAVGVDIGVFAAGADSRNNMQRASEYNYVSTSAVAEIALLIVEFDRMDKIRVAFAETGVVASPGTLACYYKMEN